MEVWMGRENDDLLVSPADAAARLFRCRRPSAVVADENRVRLQVVPFCFDIIADLCCKFHGRVWYGCWACFSENYDQVGSGGRKGLALGRGGVAVSAADIAMEPPLLPLQVVAPILNVKRHCRT